MNSLFTVGEKYSRKDIYRILNVPKNEQEGIWNTGYRQYNDDFFIFVNIKSPGRTGHEYGNEFIGDNLQWFSKETHSLNTKTIQQMINPRGNNYIFTREDNKNIYFTFQGVGKVKKYFDTKPVKIIWEFIK